jgi:3-oxoacyl-(acyl-carrier-protein) synthase
VTGGVVVTGIGAVTPAGVGMSALWESAESAKSCISAISRFDASRYACPVAGQAPFRSEDHLALRFAKRTDRFTHMAVVAVRQALADAAITVGGDVAPERVAVMVGNILGGWEFAERELRKLWVEGARAVSPYQATAWFPAAPQGNISIDQGIKGPARTFIADRASGAYAVVHGAAAIARGQADVVIAGGTEAPLSPYGWLCLETSGLVAKAKSDVPDDAMYRPFDAGHAGSVFGEGSVFLILEREETARRRGAEIYGEIAGWGLTTDGYMPYYTVEPSGQVLARAMKTAVGMSGITPADVGAVFAHGSAIPVEDVTEAYAIQEALGDAAERVPVTVPKATYGHLLGAAAPADIALSLWAMRAGKIPPTANLERLAPGLRMDVVRGMSRNTGTWEHTMVISRGLGGVNACVLVRR